MTEGNSDVRSAGVFGDVLKAEHQIINLRHLQHHMAHLGDRVRSHADVGIGWVGSRARSESPKASSTT